VTGLADERGLEDACGVIMLMKDLPTACHELLGEENSSLI
jgi:hypothetical protein